MTTTRILAHGIGGGWDLRHEGCAPRCCEADATAVDLLADGADAIAPNQSECSGCNGSLFLSPGPMDFDRATPCDWHADAADFDAHRAADPHCTCNDCVARLAADQERALAQE